MADKETMMTDAGPVPDALVSSFKNITALIEGVKRHTAKSQANLDSMTGKIGTPTPYPLSMLLSSIGDHNSTEAFKKIGEVKPYYGGEPRRSPALARMALKAAYDASLPLVEPNNAIVDENARVISALLEMIGNAGFPRYVKEYVAGRGRKSGTYEQVAAGWTKLGSGIATADSWLGAAKRYDELLKLIDKWESDTVAAREREVEEQAKKEAIEKERIEKENTRITLAVKYGLAPVTATASEIRDAIIETDKYLRLAHYLRKNRGDWSDGPHYAKIGLDGFDATDTPDGEIVRCIRPLIDDWDGDGRVFRDSMWSYDRIFKLAKPEALTDYNTTASIRNSDDED